MEEVTSPKHKRPRQLSVLCGLRNIRDPNCHLNHKAVPSPSKWSESLMVSGGIQQ